MKNSDIPVITTDQMREVDRLMVEEYGIGLIQMMENAGRNLAALARDLFLGGNPEGRCVLVFAGSGGNGGGGMVAARHLANWGADVQVYTTRIEGEMSGVPAHQFAILRQMGVPVHLAQSSEVFPEADLILDAIIGYSLTGPPRGLAVNLIRVANTLTAGGTPVLSLDVPSGMDSTTGGVHDPHIRATATMTLALPKTGLVKDHARDAVGELYLADISVPPGLYTALAIDLPPIFTEGEIIRLA